MTRAARINASRHPWGASGLSLMWGLYRDDLGKLGIALIFYVIKTSPLWLMPFLVSQVITLLTITQKPDFALFTFYILLIFLVILQNVPTHYLYFRFLSTVTRKMERKLRSDIIERLYHLSTQFYHRTNRGTLQSKLLRDVETIEQFTKQLFEGLIQSAMLILVAVVVTAISSPWFLLFYLLTVPVSLVLRSEEHTSEL